MKKWHYFVAGGLLLLIGCFHIEFPCRVTVKDAETGEPLSEVVALLELKQTCYFPPNIAGPSPEFLGLIETVSDGRGLLRFPLKVYLRPPLLYLPDRYYRLLKPGFFPSAKWKKSREVRLYRMTHYLNYLAHRDGNMEYLLPRSERMERSALYKGAVEKMKVIQVHAADEEGVFFRLEGRQFSRIHRRGGQLGKSFGSELYYVRDERSRDWFVVDCRGTKVELNKKNVPRPEFASFGYSSGCIFATRDSVFYPIEENPRPAGMTYSEGEIRYIALHIGDISALVGTSDGFVTIEGDGGYLCNYGDSYRKRKKSGGKPSADQYGPYFLKSCTSGDLPRSADDDTLDRSQFKYMVDTSNRGLIVLTRTPTRWHIYSVSFDYDQTAKKDRVSIEEVTAFSPGKEVTAIVDGRGDDVFLAFKGEGIRKYSCYPDEAGYQLKEDEWFHLNSRGALQSDVSSMVVGTEGTPFALYATTGEDRIYRFSLEGIPDFIVKRM